MDEDEDDFISEEEFMQGLVELQDGLQPLLDRAYYLLGRLEERVMEEGAHDCPTDHQVYESLDQGKIRLAEAIMWFRNAAASKVASQVAVRLGTKSEHGTMN